MADVRIKLEKTNRKLCTTQESLRFIVIMANCFALLPVSGVISNEKYFHFNWKSLKLLYSLVVTAASFYTLVVGAIYLTQRTSLSLIGK